MGRYTHSHLGEIRTQVGSWGMGVYVQYTEERERAVGIDVYSVPGTIPTYNIYQIKNLGRKQNRAGKDTEYLG